MPKFINSLAPAIVLLAVFLTSSTVFAQNDDTAARAVSLFQKGQDAHEKGELAKAIQLYGEALKLLPEFPEAELQRGSAYLSIGKSNEAEASFRKVLELRGDWPLAMASLGSVLVTQKKYEEASSLLKRSIELEPMGPLALSAMADLLLETKAPAAALREHLARLNAFDGKVRPTAGLLVAKAAIEEKLGERSSAKESAARALQIEGKSPSATSLLAEIALDEKDIEKADGYIRDLEAIAPASPSTAVLRGRVLLARGKKTEALAALESIKDPTDPVKEMIAKLKLGETTDLSAIEALSQKNPNDADVLTRLCVGFRVQDPAKALDYCRRASTLEPNEISHAINFGAALVQAKQYNEAVGLFRKLQTLQPEHATIRANLATALFQLKRYPEAKTEFVWLTENQPTSAAAFYFLGIIHDQLEEYLDAYANYQQFLKLAERAAYGLEIDKVNLRMPALEKQLKERKGKKTR